MKEVVIDNQPKCIKGIEFGILSPQQIVKQSEVEVSTNKLYDLENGRTPAEHGAIDRRMVRIRLTLFYWQY